MDKMSSCPYKDILGIRGQGVHSDRIFGLARNDIIGTILLSLATSILLNIPLWKTLLFWFILGEILHYIFGVNSAFLEFIGLSPSCL